MKEWKDKDIIVLLIAYIVTIGLLCLWATNVSV
jgi:hypothetical protein